MWKKSTDEFRAIAGSQEQEWRIQEEKKLKTKNPNRKKLSRGASLRGQGSPGLSCPPPQ